MDDDSSNIHLKMEGGFEENTLLETENGNSIKKETIANPKLFTLSLFNFLKTQKINKKSTNFWTIIIANALSIFKTFMDNADNIG